VSTNRVQDLLQREADIAVRMGPPKQEALVVKRVGDVEVGLHAREEYLAARGVPKQAADLSQHALIGFDEETPFLRAAARAFPMWRRESFSFRTSSDVGQLTLIRAGCGIGACQVKLARREPKLVRVLPKAFAFKLETWVTMHEDLRGSPRCRVTFDALVKGLQAYAGQASAT
jgi:DNA-binding transcriptional LysR family regulator